MMRVWPSRGQLRFKGARAIPGRIDRKLGKITLQWLAVCRPLLLSAVATVLGIMNLS